MQELKALDIRMESFIHHYFQEEGKRDAGCMCGRSLLFLACQPLRRKNAELKQIEVEAEITPFEPLLKKQKSAKAFFEQNEKATFIEAIRDVLHQMTTRWADNEKKSC